MTVIDDKPVVPSTPGKSKKNLVQNPNSVDKGRKMSNMLGIYNNISIFQPSDKAIVYAGAGGQGVMRHQKMHAHMDHRKLI